MNKELRTKYTDSFEEILLTIKEKEPNIKGFFSQNLWRMKQFYETYKDNEKLSTLSREIPCSQLLDKLLLQQKW